MADSIKVSTDDLSACAGEYIKISEEFNTKAGQVAEKINAVIPIWQGNFSEDIDDVLKNFRTAYSSIYKNCQELSAFLNAAVKKYTDVDRGLIPATEVGNTDYPSGVEISCPNINPHMGSYSMKQGDYGYFTKPYGYNAGCCATAYAIGLSMVTGQAYDPTSFWSQSGGTTYYSAGHIGGYTGFDPNAIYEALKNGKPTMLHYKYTSKGGRQSQHWVVVKGVASGAKPGNITINDLIVIDPYTGGERTMADLIGSVKVFDIQGMKTFT